MVIIGRDGFCLSANALLEVLVRVFFPLCIPFEKEKGFARGKELHLTWRYLTFQFPKWHVLRERKLLFCKAVILQFMAEQAGSLQCRIKHWFKPLHFKGSLNSSDFFLAISGLYCPMESCRRCLICS